MEYKEQERVRKSEISSPRKTIKQVNHKRFTFPLLYDNTSQELSCEYIRVLLKTYAVLSFSSLHSRSALLPLPPPRDQCSYANWGFLFRRTVEPTFQNKSALKCHTYFMDLKCSKSKSILDGGARRSFFTTKREQRRKRGVAWHHFGIDEALLHLRESTVDYEHVFVVNNEAQRQRNF